MNANSKVAYMVLSIKNLRNMLEVAEKISAEHGASCTDVDCIVYRGEVVLDNQFSPEIAQPVGSKKTFHATALFEGSLWPKSLK